MATREKRGNPNVTVFSFCLLILLLPVGIRAQSFSLAADFFGESSITLCWTAPGDDGTVGQAAGYEIRYSTVFPENDPEAWWDMAEVLSEQPIPAKSGVRQCHTIMDFNPEQTYYFAIKAYDEANNWSQISNIASSDYNYFPCADVDGNNRFNLLDIFYLIDLIFHDGNSPAPGTGDVNDDGNIDLFDLIHLVDYHFKSGPEPYCAE